MRIGDLLGETSLKSDERNAAWRALVRTPSSSRVRIEKDFVGKRPRTRASVTSAGGRAFRGHMNYLRELMESAGGG
jgi:hypothetical protein